MARKPIESTGGPKAGRDAKTHSARLPHHPGPGRHPQKHPNAKHETQLSARKKKPLP